MNDTGAVSPAFRDISFAASIVLSIHRVATYVADMPRRLVKSPLMVTTSPVLASMGLMLRLATSKLIGDRCNVAIFGAGLPEIAKIEKKAQKESLKLRTNQWRMDLLTATANTALSLTRTAQMGFPQAIPFMIAAAAAGTAATATIAANKPKFAMGGVFDGNGIVSGTRMNGDTVNANINAGEAVINREQMRNFMDIANGKSETVNNNQRTNHITVNALEPQTAAGAVVKALEHASQNNMVDTSVLSVAAV